MEINDIISHIMTKMTDTDELNHLKKVINMRRKSIASNLKNVLVPGDRVYVEGDRVTAGFIEKVNRTKAIVRADDGQSWNVPLTMIKVTGE